MNRSSHPGRFQTVIFRFRLGELGLAEVQKVASSRGLTEASIFRMGLALALDEVARRPIGEIASGLEITGASSPSTSEPLAHRSAVVKLRIHARERTRLTTAALAHQVAEASLTRLGVTLVLAALQRDPRPQGWQHGFPAELPKPDAHHTWRPRCARRGATRACRWHAALWRPSCRPTLSHNARSPPGREERTRPDSRGRRGPDFAMKTSDPKR